MKGNIGKGSRNNITAIKFRGSNKQEKKGNICKGSRNNITAIKFRGSINRILAVIILLDIRLGAGFRLKYSEEINNSAIA